MRLTAITDSGKSNYVMPVIYTGMPVGKVPSIRVQEGYKETDCSQFIVLGRSTRSEEDTYNVLAEVSDGSTLQSDSPVVTSIQLNPYRFVRHAA